MSSRNFLLVIDWVGGWVVPLFRRCLGRERTAATARLRCIGVAEREAAFFEALVIVPFGAIEIQRALLVDRDAKPRDLGQHVVVLANALVKIEFVSKTAAPAAGHSDSQSVGGVGSLLIRDKLLEFLGRFFADLDRHCVVS